MKCQGCGMLVGPGFLTKRLHTVTVKVQSRGHGETSGTGRIRSIQVCESCERAADRGAAMVTTEDWGIEGSKR